VVKAISDTKRIEREYMRIKLGIPWFLSAIFLIWASVSTMMLLHNPLPFPDRGHRTFGVQDDRARQVVVDIIAEVGGIKPRFTFDSGVTHQTLLWDGFTTINYLDPPINKTKGIPVNGLSLPVDDPLTSAKRTVDLLQQHSYKSNIVEDIDVGLPPNHLVLVQSDAFAGWVMVFRRPTISMPYPKTRQ